MEGITEENVGLKEEPLSLRKPVERPNLSGPERMKVGVLISRGIKDCIPEDSVLLDVGCGSGRLGAVLACESNSTLLQADVEDRRDKDYRYDFLGLSNDELPEIPEQWCGVADRILLNDVLQHVSYPELEMGRQELLLKYLRSLQPLLKEEGRMIISFTNRSADQLEGDKGFWEKVRDDPELEGKVVVL